MLSTEVTANLDYLASLGVLDYDAAAHIAGTRPRYYGSPSTYVPPVVMTSMDYYTPSSQASNSNPFAPQGAISSIGFPSFRTIGKLLLGLGGLYLGGKAFLRIAQSVKGFSFNNLFSRGKKAASNAASGIQNGINQGRQAVQNAAGRVGIGNKPWYKKCLSSIRGIFKR